MRENIYKRAIELGEHVVNTGETVRAAASKFGISKSTVHKDLTERLKIIDEKLYKRVRLVLEKNLSERHIRGGLATKFKYERKSFKNRNG